MHFKTSSSNLYHKHQQEVYVSLIRFKGVAVWPNALKREICDKNIFSDNAEWSYEKLQKMISADLKTDVKQYEQRPGPINL